jgi:hypothetical protein
VSTTTRHHRTTLRERLAAERGVSLIQVGILIFMLTGFCAFVLDNGVVLMARRQAQNAADAGALAGAIARAYDERTDPPAANGEAYQSAFFTARENVVFGQAPGINVSWECPAYAAGARCVRVDALRDGTGVPVGPPLPSFFGVLFGIDSHVVRATATAWVAYGNSTNCMRPFSVADQWEELAGDPDRYDRWSSQGNQVVESNPHDVYVPPSEDNPGTGYTVEDHYGTELILKGGNNPNSDSAQITPGWFLPVRLPDGAGGYSSGANDYRAAIGTCIGNPVSIGDYLPTENGAMIGPTSQGYNDLRNLDPGAYWDSNTQTVAGSCAPACGPISPRIVPLSVFDLDEFQYRRAANDWNVCPTGGRCIRVVNIIGFFVSHMSGQDVVGYLINYPGEFGVGSPTVSESASFLTTIQLIR